MAASPPPYAYQSEAQRSFTTPQDYYRLRDFGQKFEAAIAFLRKHGGNLYRILLVPLLVSILPLGGVMALFSRSFNLTQLAGRTGQGANVGLALMMPAMFGLVALIMAALLVQYTMLYGFVKRRMHQPDAATPISAGEAWDEGKRYLLPMIGYSVVAGVLVVLGYFLLLLPGVYLTMAVLLLPCVVVFEDADLGTSFSRCLQLIRGKWWSTFGLYLVGSMVMGLVSGGVGVVITLATTIFSLKSSDTQAAVTGLAVAQAIQMSINLLLTPLLYVLLMFQYFNLVERRDHVSLQWRAEQLGQQPGGPAAPIGPTDDTLFRPSYGDQAL